MWSNTTERSRGSTETPNGGLVSAFAHPCSCPVSPFHRASSSSSSLSFSLPISKSQIINNQKGSESSPSTQQIARSSVHSTRNSHPLPPRRSPRSPPGTNALLPLLLSVAALIRVLTPCGRGLTGIGGWIFFTRSSLSLPSAVVLYGL